MGKETETENWRWAGVMITHYFSWLISGPKVVKTFM